MALHQLAFRVRNGNGGAGAGRKRDFRAQPQGASQETRAARVETVKRVDRGNAALCEREPRQSGAEAVCVEDVRLETS